ncbi:MAG: PD40 domain-containing protein [Ignavibacteria bacterium]|nr:PD40 domain-containing protein [Ignavibacteria bacterium]MBI3764947.1 PD40 domain-containing protein [Ignavibacteriales bacterium]
MNVFRLLLTILVLLFLTSSTFTSAQETIFGKNKVQYKNFEWFFIQSNHFDVYFSKGGESLAEFTADHAESSYAAISKSFRYQITNRIAIVVYNSHNDFQQTNVVNSYLEEGIGGVTELFKNRVVLPFEGDYKKFRHVIHHELVHAVLNDMFYGGSIQSIITNNITLQLPLWFNEGLAEYEALQWDTNSDMFLRDATVHEYLPPIQQLNGYFAYRGGQSLWNYIATKYGDQKIAEILTRIKGMRSVDQGFRSAIGLSIEELSERWQKEQKVLYWPDIAKRQEPADYARKLTDHTKDGSFYNTSPAISPQGDRIAFISNRDDYFDVFIMNSIDGTIQEKLINGQRTPDFEELHLLTPGMAWSSDGKRLALAAKSGDQDAIIIIDVNSGHEEKLEFALDGIFSVDWSPQNPDSTHHNGKLAFVGITSGHSDIYVYDLDDKQLTNLTDDIFSDADPAWSTDGKTIFFSSDRGKYLSQTSLPLNFKMQRYDSTQMDIYNIDASTHLISRVTDFPTSDETSPVPAPDGKHLYFISDVNGINNIYMKDLSSDTLYPKTNSLSGVYQLSLSHDGNKLVFNSLNNGGFDLFLMRGPQEGEEKLTKLEPTEYLKRMAAIHHPAAPAVAHRESVKVGDDIVIKMDKQDSTNLYGNDVKIDLRNYVFNDRFKEQPERQTDTAKLSPIANNVDENGNYKVNKYKINFSPDIVYGNAGYNTYYGVQGSTIMAFSDMLGNHQIYVLTNLLFDLKNSDYALAYFYLPKRIDYGIEGFHNARFVYIQDQFGNDSVRYRFRNYGVSGIASLPLNRFERFDFSLSWYNISRDNIDDAFDVAEKRSLVLPSISYIHDTSLWGIIAPDNGERYNVSLMASPKLGDRSLGFYSVTADYRHYYRLWRNYTFALRLAGGGSFGQDPQRFIIGGVDNWINRQFENNRIPIERAEDFVFLTSGIPLRGYNYNARMGTKYGLMNMEFRFPLFGYFTAGPLPVFFQSLSGVLFLDMGGAWTNSRDFKAFDKDENSSIYMRDLLAGTGYGIRMIFLGFLLKMDVAWSFNLKEFSTPKYYFSVGADI